MITGWWVLRVYETQGPLFLTAWVIWVVASVTLHELAHGWMAIRKGDSTPIDAGHMTLNPIVHMGGTSLLVFALTGICWGAMPVDPTRMRGRWAETLVLAAGPGMNFAIAVVCVLAGGAWLGLVKPGGAVSADLHDNLLMFFMVGASLNVALGLFNLLPIIPLDGGRIVASVHRGYGRWSEGSAGQFLNVALFIVAFFMAGRLVFGAGGFVAKNGIGTIGGLLRMVTGAP